METNLKQEASTLDFTGLNDEGLKMLSCFFVKGGSLKDAIVVVDGLRVKQQIEDVGLDDNTQREALDNALKILDKYRGVPGGWEFLSQPETDPAVSNLQTWTAPPKKPVAALACKLKLSVNSAFSGSSSALNLLFALMSHRQEHLHSMLRDVSAGDYETAHNTYRDLCDTIHIADELTMALMNQAEQNYWAKEGPHSKQTVEQRKREDYHQFLKIIDISPENV